MSSINLGTFHGYDWAEGYGYFTVYFDYSSVTWYNGKYTINGCKVRGNCGGGYTTNPITVSGSGGCSGSFSSQTSFSFSGSSFTYTSSGGTAYGTVRMSRPTGLSSVPSGWGGWISNGTYYKDFTVAISGSGTDRTAPTITILNPTVITKDRLVFPVQSNATSNKWQYTIDNGAHWTTFDSGNKTSTTLTLTGLAVNTTYNVRVRATKYANGLVGTSGVKSAKTLGPSEFNQNSYTADVGTQIDLTWTRYVEEYAHELWVEFGNINLKIAENLDNTAYSWTAPTSYAEQMPDSNSMTGKLHIYSYDGDILIGSDTTDLILTIPSSWAPSVQVLTTPVSTKTWIMSENIYVINHSKVRVQVNATPAIGTEIANYHITGLDTTGNTNDWTSNTFTTFGAKDITITVTDQRGRVTTQISTIYVYDYTLPVITKLSYERGNYENSVWTKDDSGEDLKVLYSTDHHELNGSNTLNITVKLGNTNVEVLTDSTGVTDRVVYKKNIGTVSAYELVVTATDKLNSSTQKSISVPPTNIPFVLDFNRDSVGVGGVPQSTKSFEVWDNAIFRKEAILKDTISWNGTTLQAADSLDEISTKGKYYCATERTFGNAGSSNNFSLYVLTPFSDSNRILQFVLCRSNTCERFMRIGIKYSDTVSWGDWQKLDEVTKAYVDDSITDAINPLKVDYIIERGTSGIWTYEKWDSGKSLCQTSQQIVATNWNAWGGMYEGSPYLSNISFPTNLFNSIPSVFTNVHLVVQAGGVLHEIGQVTSTSIQYIVPIRPIVASGSMRYQYDIQAIGKWK